jgi:hypothetical protein
MNESELESELRKLRPAAPSRELEDGIARGLAQHREVTEPQRERHAASAEIHKPWLMLWLDRLMWSGLGATATLLILLAIQRPQDTSVAHPLPSPPLASSTVAPLDVSTLQPVLAAEEDLGWRDEGVRFDAHGQPLLKLTRTTVERQAWADLQNAGVVQVERPRQEVMWVPVSLH